MSPHPYPSQQLPLSPRTPRCRYYRPIYPGFANYCDLYQTSSSRFLLPIPLCPRTCHYTLRTPRPSFCHVTTRAGTSTGPPPPLPPPQVSPSPDSLPSSLPTSSSTPSPSSSTALSHPAVILHHRLGHPNFAALRTTVTSRLLHSLPPTLPPLPSSPAPPCPSCIHGKLKQSPHHSHPTFAAAPIDLVHMDLWGPYPIRSRQRHRYMLVLVDDHSRYSTVFFLHTKDQMPAVVINLAEQCRNHLRRLIGRLHSDGGELWSKAKPDAAGLRVWGCKSFILIPPADRSRAAGKLAPRALECVYLGHNRDSPSYLFLHHPTNRLIRSIDVVFDESIPYYSTPPPDSLPPPSRPLAWTDTVLPPLLPPSPLLPLVAAPLPLSSADVYDPAAPASPAHSAATPPPSPSSSHSPPFLQRPGQQQQLGQHLQQQQSTQQQGQQQQQVQQQRHRATSRSSPFLLPRMHTRSLDKVFGAPPPASIQLLEDSHAEFLAIRHHTPLLASIFHDFLGLPILGATSTPTIFTPSTFKEAIACPDADKWIAAIFLECEAFIRNDSFVNVPLPADANLVEGKWVFRVKQLPGEDPVYKARYCAKGFTQTWAEDYWFTYAPTAKPPTLRTLLDVDARDDMEICSMDVSNAFLQGDLHERIFLRRPPRFHAAFPENTVWQLRRPVYGLKQAPREWHAKLSATMGSLGFSASHFDACLFLRSSPRRFFILVYVDDMILLADSKTDMEQMKQQLQQRLKCKDLGDLTHYLGMAITRDRPARTITLSQSHDISQILEKFEMTRASPIATPLPFGHQLDPPTSPSSSSHSYAELFGLLMYAMMCTRPDLTYPISVLTRFVGPGRHTEVHWKAAKRVLRYHRGTKDHALTLGGSSPPFFSGFSDSSWADSQPDRRSSQGYGFTLGSGLVSWRSTRSSSVSLSSCEAELYAGTMAAQESRWLCILLAELGAPQPCPTLWCDNASTIHLTQDPVYHACFKHIELRYFLIRKLVQRGFLAVRKIAA
ncbi:unnamed protein product [Closterium sp. NIES-54]